MEPVAGAVRASSVAELIWTDPDGAPDGCGVIAQAREGTPVVAFTYAMEAQARAAAAAPQVVLTLTEVRSTGRTFAPLAAVGRPRLLEDLDGSVFCDELLETELRRYPPARKFADSAMLRREHWWYLPRLLLHVDVQSVRPLPVRETPREHVLVVATDDGLDARVIRPESGSENAGSALRLSATDDSPLPVGRAALLGQDASFPDLERWSSWCFRGSCDGSRLRLTQPVPSLGLPPVPSIWKRARDQYAFGRACRAGITRAERRR